MDLRALLHAAADALADAAEAATKGPADALVPLSAEGLAPFGLEYKPTLKLADEGTLKTVAIGRRRFTTVRHLLALVDALPAADRQSRESTPAEVDEVVDAARRRARRVA